MLFFIESSMGQFFWHSSPLDELIDLPCYDSYFLTTFPFDITHDDLYSCSVQLGIIIIFYLLITSLIFRRLLMLQINPKCIPYFLPYMHISKHDLREILNFYNETMEGNMIIISFKVSLNFMGCIFDFFAKFERKIRTITNVSFAHF